MNGHEVVLPDGWPQPRGYSNGILASQGRILFVAGQVGWDAQEVFHSDNLIPQFAQALRNVVAIVDKAGGEPEHICRMTCFCKDRNAYLKGRGELGKIWRTIIGGHYPCMSLIFVDDLLDRPGLIEIEATAVIPHGGRVQSDDRLE